MIELDRVSAAQAVIGAHNIARHMEPALDPSVDLYHLLDSLLVWADASGVDFDATLYYAREDQSAQ